MPGSTLRSEKPPRVLHRRLLEQAGDCRPPNQRLKPLSAVDTIKDRLIGKRRTRIYLSALRAVARKATKIQIRMAPNAPTADAVPLLDTSQQVHHGRQLFLWEWIDSVSVVDEFNGNRACAKAIDVVCNLIFRNAAAHCSVAVDHVVNPQDWMGLDVSQVLVQSSAAYPCGLARLCITSGATCGVDDCQVDALTPNCATAARIGSARRRAERCGDQPRQCRTPQGAW
jgi:hypothetical protein